MSGFDEPSQQEIEELIEEVYSFLPEEISNTLTEEQVEIALEKYNYDIKATLNSFKKRNDDNNQGEKKSKYKRPLPNTNPQISFTPVQKKSYYHMWGQSYPACHKTEILFL